MTATAETLCWSHLLVWGRDVVQGILEQNPALAVGALRVLSTRIEDFRSRYRELSTERVETRIARVLFRAFCEWSRSAETIGDAEDKSPNGTLDLPLSRRDLADMAGTTLYTVSRVVQDWERRGILRAGRMRVTMLDPTSLPLSSGQSRIGAEPRIQPIDLRKIRGSGEAAQSR